MSRRGGAWRASLVFLYATHRTLAVVVSRSNLVNFVPPSSIWPEHEPSRFTRESTRIHRTARSPRTAARMSTAPEHDQDFASYRALLLATSGVTTTMLSSPVLGAFLPDAVAAPSVRFYPGGSVVDVADAGEMGARLDAPAAISFGAVVVAFAFLQGRIRVAIKTRAARRDFEQILKEVEKKRLAGMADEEEVSRVAERMSQLVQEEQEARTLEIFGIPFNLVIPDGSESSRSTAGRQGRDLSGPRSSSSSGRELGIREAVKAKEQANRRDEKAREEEMSPMATLKVAALWLVLISQLWLLTVLWHDPMGPATSAFLKD